MRGLGLPNYDKKDFLPQAVPLLFPWLESERGLPRGAGCVDRRGLPLPSGPWPGDSQGQGALKPVVPKIGQRREASEMQSHSLASPVPVQSSSQ